MRWGVGVEFHRRKYLVIALVPKYDLSSGDIGIEKTRRPVSGYDSPQPLVTEILWIHDPTPGARYAWAKRPGAHTVSLQP